jgi:membrane protease YdiL (CAAX protease family)
VITLVNGIAEELFFRGALFAAIGMWHPVLISTVLYASTTIRRRRNAASDCR